MKLIVGLGNPGAKYVNTRHNLGSMAVRLLARSYNNDHWDNWQQVAQIIKLVINDQEFRLALPTRYMNQSGPVVQQLVSFYQLELKDLWIVHDDIDLPFGAIRLSWQASSAGHRGVESIISSLGTSDWWRWRLGVGRPPEDLPVEKYVLQPFTESEQNDLPVFLSQAVTKLKITLAEGARSVRVAPHP